MAHLDAEDLLELALALHRGTDPGVVCRLVVEALDQRGLAPVCALLASEEGLKIRASAGEVPEPETTIDVHGALYRRLRTGVPVSVADDRAIVLGKLGANMAYPLEGRQRLVGLLTAHVDKTAHAALQLLVPHLGTALDNAGERIIARREVEARVREQGQQLAEHVRRFELTTSLPILLERILDQASTAAGAEKASLMLLDEASDELVLRVVRGLPDKAVEERINRGEVACTRFKRGQGVAGRVLATSEPILVRDTKQDDRFDRADGAHAKALLCLPLVHQGLTLGVLNLSCSQAPDGLHHSPLLLGLCEAAAAAIERARLYQAAVMDPETGLHGEPLVRSILESEARRSDRYGNPLSVVLCSLGHAQDGHTARELGDGLRRTMRTHIDLAGHLGDRVFLLVLPETRVHGAGVLCRRLGAELAELRDARAVHAFAVAERPPRGDTGRLLHRLGGVLTKLVERGPGVHIAALA